MKPIIGITSSAGSLTAKYCVARYQHTNSSIRMTYENINSNGYFYPSLTGSIIRQNNYNGILWKKQGSYTRAPFVGTDNDQNTYNGNNDGLSTLSKIDKFGNQVWGKYFTGLPGIVAVTSDGTSVYTSGSFYRSASDRGWAILKLDTDGNIIWQKEIKRSDNFYYYGTNLVYDPSTDSLVFISSSSVMKVSASTGSVIWYKQFEWDYSGSGTYVTAYGTSATIAVDKSNGNIAFGVRMYTSPGSQYYGALIVLNSSGSVLWTKKYGYESSVAPEVSIDSNGNVYTFWAGSTVPAFSAIIKYDSSGNQLWANNLFVGDTQLIAQPTYYYAAYSTINTTDDTLLYSAGGFNFVYFLKVPADGTKTSTTPYRIFNGNNPSIWITYQVNPVVTGSAFNATRMTNISHTQTTTTRVAMPSDYNATSLFAEYPQVITLPIY